MIQRYALAWLLVVVTVLPARADGGAMPVRTGDADAASRDGRFDRLYADTLGDMAMQGRVAVGCGMRSEEWGRSFHERLMAELHRHVAPPGTQPTPGAAEAERDALDQIQARELQAFKVEDLNGSDKGICPAIGPTQLKELDEREHGAATFWPFHDSAGRDIPPNG